MNEKVDAWLFYGGLAAAVIWLLLGILYFGLLKIRQERLNHVLDEEYGKETTEKACRK